MTTSFKTCLTPEEHIHMFGTLAPEQVEDFIESYIGADTAQEISDMLGNLTPPTADEFEGVLVGLDLALPTDDLVANLRSILQHSFHDGDRAMDLLAKIERDQASSAFAVRKAKADIKGLRASTTKFAVDLEQTVIDIKDELGV